MNQKTLNYLKRAKEIHGEKYDYSLIKHIKNTIEKLPIICKIHGIFKQAFKHHIWSESGCPRCNGSFYKTKEEFLIDAVKIYGNKYNYDKVNYINAHTNVIVTCPEHGDFLVSPTRHTHGDGRCSACRGRFVKDTESFIKRANFLHDNKYEYSKTKFINAKTPIIITCLKHGDFKQTPDSHISGRCGCPKCTRRSSGLENKWLDSLNIPNLKRQFFIKIGDKKYYVDGYDLDTNTIYEFYGDYFHGNPVYYNWNNQNVISHKSFGKLYEETEERERVLKEGGYKVVVMWENQWLKISTGKTRSEELNQTAKIYPCISYIKQWEMADDEWDFSEMKRHVMGRVEYEISEAKKLKFN